MSTKNYAPIRLDDEDKVTIQLVITAPNLRDPQETVLSQVRLLTLEPHELFNMPHLATILKRIGLLLGSCSDLPVPAAFLPDLVREILKLSGAAVMDINLTENENPSTQPTDIKPSDN
jgi:hypothetical protein